MFEVELCVIAKLSVETDPKGASSVVMEAHAVGQDDASARESYKDTIGVLSEAEGFRIAGLRLTHLNDTERATAIAAARRVNPLAALSSFAPGSTAPFAGGHFLTVTSATVKEPVIS